MRVVLLAACALTAGAYVSTPGRILRCEPRSVAASSFNALGSSRFGLRARTSTQSRSARLSPLCNPRMAAASSGPKTLFDKIWNDHVVDEQPDGTTLLYIDRHLVHEVTSPQAFEGLRAAGRKARRPENTLATVDHNVPTTDRSMFESVETFIKEVESQTQVCIATHLLNDRDSCSSINPGDGSGGERERVRPHLLRDGRQAPGHRAHHRPRERLHPPGHDGRVRRQARTDDLRPITSSQ